jgi:hypothetical protein
MSYVTRLIPATSLVIREDMRFKTAGGKTYLDITSLESIQGAELEKISYQSAVIKSSVCTARRATT